jgi:hypothetical protein
MEAELSKMAESIKQLHPMEQHKLQSLSRTQKRQTIRINHGADSRPFARVRSGIRTGTPKHFRLWMAAIRMKSALQRKSTAVLADHIADVPLATSFALLHGAGFRNVYAVTQADARDLLCIRGIGPKRLEAVKTYLASVNVGVRW